MKIKTKIQAQKMLDTIKAEIARLPQYNAFGESNERDLQDLREWRDELESFIKDDAFTAKSEVGNWLDGTLYSALNDLE